MRQKKLLVKLLFLSLLILSSCKKEDNPGGITPPDNENTPQNNFNVLWNDFDQNYPVFELNDINWDSVYYVYYPKITLNTTDADLFNILKSCILTLKDAHSDIISNQFGSCDYYDLFVQQKPTNFISWNLISSKYVQVLKSNNQHLAYGKVLNEDIGYFFIGSFDDSASNYYLIDSLLTVFQNSKGIIIDVRQNGGGNETYAQIVASRLTNTSVIYRYYRERNGPKHSDLTGYFPVVLVPGGPIKYTKTVVLLTSRRTFSAAEDFTLMLKSLPNVIHIGDTTFGGVATNPITKTLPNGWTYRMARAIECDNNEVPIKNGIVPQIPVQISKADSIQGVDRILEEAINKINGN